MKRDLYETKISTTRWMAYDIPGNVGWILYIAVLVRLFRDPPAYMDVLMVKLCLIAGILPAAAIAVGILELISERIAKLSRVLPRVRLYRGFGALTWGSSAGVVTSLAALFAGVRAGFSWSACGSLILLAAGAALCALFAGLIYKSFYRQTEHG